MKRDVHEICQKCGGKDAELRGNQVLWGLHKCPLAPSGPSTAPRFSSINDVNFVPHKNRLIAYKEADINSVVATLDDCEKTLKTLERECSDADQIILALGLTVDYARTEGGSLHLPRIKARIAELSGPA